MATFKELQDQVLRHLRDQGGYMRVAVKEWIRWTLYDLADRGDFPWWHGEAAFATDSFYATGRASVKLDKMQVSGSATAWNKYAADAKLVFSASSPGSTKDWYRVQNRPTKTTINLTAPYRGASKTRKKYVLFRDEYNLRYNVDRILRIRYLARPDKLVDFWPRELYDYDANPSRTGDPEIYRVVGVSERPRWNAFTASFVANSKVVTGKTGTSWDATVIGRTIRNANDGRYYEISSYKTATSVRISKAYTGSNAGAKAYQIDPPGTPVIQLYPIPTKKRHFVYEYQRLPQLPYVDADVPDLPEKHHEILIWGALVRGHLQGAVVEPTALAMAKEIYYGFTPQKMSAKAKMSIDRIQQMGSWDRGHSHETGRLEPWRWRRPL